MPAPPRNGCANVRVFCRCSHLTRTNPLAPLLARSWVGFYTLASDRQTIPSLLALLMAPQVPHQLQLSVLALILELLTPPAAAISEGLPALSGGVPIIPAQAAVGPAAASMTPPASGCASGSHLDAVSAQALALAFGAQRASRQHRHWAANRKLLLQQQRQQEHVTTRMERVDSWVGPASSQPQFPDVASLPRPGLRVDPTVPVGAPPGAVSLDLATPRGVGVATPDVRHAALAEPSSGGWGSASLAVPYALPEARYAAPAAVPEYSARFWIDVEDAALRLTQSLGSPALSAASSAESTDGPSVAMLGALSAASHACQSEAVRAIGSGALRPSVSRALALARESPQPAPVLTPLSACDAMRAQVLVALLDAGLSRALAFAAMSPASAHPLLQRAAAAALQYVVALTMRLLPSPYAEAAWHLPDLVQVGALPLSAWLKGLGTRLAALPPIAVDCARRRESCASPAARGIRPRGTRRIAGC